MRGCQADNYGYYHGLPNCGNYGTIHRPELLSHGDADRAEPAVVIDQGDSQQDEEDRRDEQQFKSELADQDDGYHHSHERVRN